MPQKFIRFTVNLKFQSVFKKFVFLAMHFSSCVLKFSHASKYAFESN
jgi:hypothetical protein